MFFLIPKVFRQRISMSLLSNGIEFKIKMKYLVLDLQAFLIHVRVLLNKINVYRVLQNIEPQEVLTHGSHNGAKRKQVRIL
jgi:hypothetical protein